MFVIRMADGRIKVPRSAISPDGSMIGDAYQELAPGDPEYDRFAEQAVTEEELANRRLQWREDDEALRDQFLAWKDEQEARGDP